MTSAANSMKIHVYPQEWTELWKTYTKQSAWLVGTLNVRFSNALNFNFLPDKSFYAINYLLLLYVLRRPSIGNAKCANSATVCIYIISDIII